ncbi:hypothetical protein EHS13_17340 [Paenibacillus psychroresistens]|uniref:Uncharacterized protein n=1 Tax=Paenibacillus psychroresistens TaxID=1778678 RepID=A0A6B8RL85_9BACL|nr:hypothetical protein [Paenibacillus psychroresistens]QGQ96524.1 hypothetical protein EHS13_17340 [Paenibacillus psychroresistens]
MTMHKNEIGLNSQTLSSYDPLIWRKDVHVVSQKFPQHLVSDSGKAGNSENNVENMFWTNVYSRTRP